MAKKEGATIIDSIKLKIIEFLTDNVKKNFKQYQKTILKSIEKQIENKIKKEIKKVTSKIINKIIFTILISLGSLFLLFGIISMIITYLKLPEFVTTIFFALILIITSLFFYNKK